MKNAVYISNLPKQKCELMLLKCIVNVAFARYTDKVGAFAIRHAQIMNVVTYLFHRIKFIYLPLGPLSPSLPSNALLPANHYWITKQRLKFWCTFVQESRFVLRTL